jgi:hypothetical protein
VNPDHEFTFVLALIVGVLAVTRLVRLIVDDDWPPVVRFREWYIGRTSDEWQPLVECPWCVAVYVAAPAVAWFALLYAFPSWTAVLWVWWVANSWMAVAWVAAFLCGRDIPPEAR